jgi:hypothetical protein
MPSFVRLRRFRNFGSLLLVIRRLRPILKRWKGGLRAVYRVGADDARMIELFDALRRAVARNELTIKRRLAVIETILARALAEQQQGGLKG